MCYEILNAGMMFHLVMDYLMKVVLSHISIWQLLILLPVMHWKTRGLHWQLVSILLELMARETLKILFVQKLRSRERFVVNYVFSTFQFVNIVWLVTDVCKYVEIVYKINKINNHVVKRKNTNVIYVGSHNHIIFN